MSSNPQCGGNSVHWLKVKRLLGSGFTVVTPAWSHDHVSMSGCVTLEIIMSLADSLACCHGRRCFSTKPSPCAVPKQYWRDHCSIRLASLRAPNCRSGGHEFEFPIWWELVHWLTWKDSWRQVFLHCLAHRILCDACCAIVLRMKKLPV